METILNHYVPRFYLRNFQVSGPINYIWCYDKQTEKKFKVNISHIGCERGFYSQEVEQHLSGLEGKSSQVLRKLMDNKDLKKISWSEREILASFIVVQDNRTHELRQTMKTIGEYFLQRFVDSMPANIRKASSKQEIDEYISAKAEKMARETQEKTLQQTIKRFSDMILGLQWILIENTTEIPYWTGDNPVNKYNPIKEKPYLGNLGYLSPGIEIFFPLSPALLLCICDMGTHSIVPSEKIIMYNVEDVSYQNYLVFNWAFRHIFANSEDFSELEKMKKYEIKESRLKINGGRASYG